MDRQKYLFIVAITSASFLVLALVAMLWHHKNCNPERQKVETNDPYPTVYSGYFSTICINGLEYYINPYDDSKASPAFFQTQPQKDGDVNGTIVQVGMRVCNNGGNK